MVSPQTRGTISNAVSTTTNAVRSVLSFGGKTLWVVSSSALLLGVPWALAWAEEQQVMEMEKEMRMREMGSEVCRLLSRSFLFLCRRLACYSSLAWKFGDSTETHGILWLSSANDALFSNIYSSSLRDPHSRAAPPPRNKSARPLARSPPRRPYKDSQPASVYAMPLPCRAGGDDTVNEMDNSPCISSR